MRVFELAPPPPTVPKSSTKSAGASAAPSSNISHDALPATIKPLASVQPRRGDTVEMTEAAELVRNGEERGKGAGMPTSEQTEGGLPQSDVQQDAPANADDTNGTAEEVESPANGDHNDWQGENGHGGVSGDAAKKDLPPLHGPSLPRQAHEPREPHYTDDELPRPPGPQSKSDSRRHAVSGSTSCGNSSANTSSRNTRAS